MKCPSCKKSELAHVELGERDFVALERCPSCHGCWLGARELERIESGAWSSVERLRLRTAQVFSDLLCPSCSAQLVTLNPEDHPELAVDRCPACHGFWLDSGELSRLHDVAVQHAAAHDDLRLRPDGWSQVRWLAYRLAPRWKQLRE